MLYMTSPQARAREIVQPYNDELIQSGHTYALEHQATLVNAIARELEEQQERDAKVAELQDYGQALNMDYQDGFDRAKEQIAAAIRRGGV